MRAEIDSALLLFPAALVRGRYRTARHHADQMRAIFGRAVDVAVDAVGRDGQAFQRLRREALLQRLFKAVTRNTPFEPAPVAATRISEERLDTNTPTSAKPEAGCLNF